MAVRLLFDRLKDGLIISPNRHPSVIGLGKYFAYGHLPEDLQDVSYQFAFLAQTMVDLLMDSPELSETLRKLWEAKNQAVLAAGFLELKASKQEKINRGDAVDEEGRTIHIG
jgi:hypothetical protein